MNDSFALVCAAAALIACWFVGQERNRNEELHQRIRVLQAERDSLRSQHSVTNYIVSPFLMPMATNGCGVSGFLTNIDAGGIPQ